MPALWPVTIPVIEFMIAVAVLPLVHVPPVGVHASVLVAPIHTLPEPVIALGNAFTVTVAVLKQPGDAV